MRTALALAAAALAFGGCGGPGRASGPAVSLELKGGASEEATACGARHHYAVYGARSTIEFAGVVRPVPKRRWKVKLKVKVCRGGAFREVEKLDTHEDTRSGGFRGALGAPGKGRFFARASLYVAERRVARSDKRHFAVR